MEDPSARRSLSYGQRTGRDTRIFPYFSVLKFRERNVSLVRMMWRVQFSRGPPCACGLTANRTATALRTQGFGGASPSMRTIFARVVNAVRHRPFKTKKRMQVPLRVPCRCGEISKRAQLKPAFPVGASPSFGTNFRGYCSPRNGEKVHGNQSMRGSIESSAHGYGGARSGCDSRYLYQFPSAFKRT